MGVTWFRSLSVLVVLLSAACHRESHSLCDEERVCRCAGLEVCEVDCEGAGCDVACSDLDDCGVSCAEDCSIDCDSLSTCQAECGERCDYSCTNASDCDVLVGDASSVSCNSVGRCAVTCEGACEVDCSARTLSGRCPLKWVACIPATGIDRSHLQVFRKVEIFPCALCYV